MQYRKFGRTGLNVSAIGLGAGHIGKESQDVAEVEKLFHAALDAGINLFDTARSYGASEERTGRFLKENRHHVILSTKVGYTYNQAEDWSYEATMGGIEESLQRLQTDYIEIVHLHSCSIEALKRGDAILALEKAQEQGKIGVAAYSGENDALQYAIQSRKFGSIQCSVNIFDQQGLSKHLPDASQSDLGIIAKRPLGNAVWRYQARPDGHGHALYYDRYLRMQPLIEGIDPAELALRYAAHAPFLSCIIIGTSNPHHLIENIKWLERGPLSDSIVTGLREKFNNLGADTAGLI